MVSKSAVRRAVEQAYKPVETGVARQAEEAQAEVRRQQALVKERQLQAARQREQLTAQRALRGQGLAERQRRQVGLRQVGEAETALTSAQQQLKEAKRSIEQQKAEIFERIKKAKERQVEESFQQAGRIERVRARMIEVPKPVVTTAPVVAGVEGMSIAPALMATKVPRDTSAIAMAQALDVGKAAVGRDVVFVRDEVGQVIEAPLPVREKLTDIAQRIKTGIKQKEIKFKLQKGKEITEAEREILGQEDFNLREEFNRLFTARVDVPLTQAARKIGVREDSILLKKLEFDPSAIALSVVFSPFIETGAAARAAQKQVAKQVQKTKKTKISSKDLEKIINKLREDFIRGNKESTRDVFRRAIRTGNKKAIKETRKIVEESIGKSNADEIFKDIAEQEGFGLAKVKVPKVRVPKPEEPAPVVRTDRFIPKEKPAPPVQRGFIQAEQIKPVIKPQPVQFEGRIPPIETPVSRFPTMEFVGQVPRMPGAGLVLGLPTLQAEAIAQPQIQFPKETELERFIQREKAAQIQPEALALAQPQLQIPALAQPQLQIPRQAQPQPQPQLEAPILAVPTVSVLGQPQPTRQVPRRPTPSRRPTPRRRFRFPAPKVTEDPTPQPLKRAAGKLVQAFEVQVKRGGVFRPVGEPLPFGKALKLGATRTEETLAATFRLVPKNGIIAEDVPFTLPARFRRPKGKAPQPFTFVERRQFRLSAPTERREIQFFKKQKGGNIKWL